jgi:hypothetical protein
LLKSDLLKRPFERSRIEATTLVAVVLIERQKLSYSSWDNAPATTIRPSRSLATNARRLSLENEKVPKSRQFFNPATM